ncbi:uncharacterized protein LOC125853348 [Solanum stenotomum]|uniref:uncharacterized protein LOC125842804 n=1 Tax=Solanum stenotomum TaxID=172797 RepID=UPI0020D14209|nr:uncharacterized protein LOC125842804 [Solanum stenotomum]XP_049388978.1 uncharacterized protein LOC125853348 [Solanum stenotomum]
MVGASFKSGDELHEAQAKEIEKALCKGELETSKGLNQELGLARARDTRWGSYYKYFNNFIFMFGPIIDVLDAIAVNTRFEEKCREKGYLITCLTFDVVFMLHFRRIVLAITNDLNAAFQKKEQDIANAMSLVGVAKNRLSCRRIAEYTILHHYRVEVFYKIIDWQRQELNNRFDEVTPDLLLEIACLNLVNSFSNFDMENILRLAELYPDDFDKYSIVDLRFQLENYIVDVRDHDKRFFSLKGLFNLSKILVETKKHITYPLVFRLVKFALLLPVLLL